MKFEKFVKQLGGAGVIHNRADGSKWLASCSAVMLIPDGVEGVIAEHITEMPQRIDTITCKELTGTPALLHRAVMPTGDSSIKECIRVYLSQDGTVKLPISNDNWGLIDPKHDVVEILTEFDFDTNTAQPAALLVKEYVGLEETRLVGVIFPDPEAVEYI